MQITPEPGAHRESHHLFFAADLTGTPVVLDQSEATHATSVMRLRPGDSLQLTNGNGIHAGGIVETVDRHSLRVQIVERRTVTRPIPHLRLFVGLPDRDAFESILLDATALGVTAITPLIAEHCRKPWWEGNWEKHRPRFLQKMIVALKQSGSCFLPELTAPCLTSEAIDHANGTVLVADPDGVPITGLTPFDPMLPVNCFIGPPGGFNEHELRLFDDRSFIRVCIAHGRLRTELAATVMCAQIVGKGLESKVD